MTIIVIYIAFLLALGVFFYQKFSQLLNWAFNELWSLGKPVVKKVTLWLKNIQLVYFRLFQLPKLKKQTKEGNFEALTKRISMSDQGHNKEWN